MRCRNCGWENDFGALKCEKCNAPLSGSMVDNRSQYSGYAERESMSSDSNLKKTVSDSSVFNDLNLRKCPDCGYLYNPDMGECPNCGGARQNACAGPVQKDSHTSLTGTVNPWSKPQNRKMCSLTPVAWEDEAETPDQNRYSGSMIVLNRDNTDPGNNTITSKEQALLTFEDGAWYLEDKSSQQTTYLHVSRKMKLEDGDIVILGNRRFIFKK